MRSAKLSPEDLRNIRKFTNLKELYLSGGNVDDVLKVVAQLPRLHKIELVDTGKVTRAGFKTL
jgi:hypothetical protein